MATVWKYRLTFESGEIEVHGHIQDHAEKMARREHGMTGRLMAAEPAGWTSSYRLGYRFCKRCMTPLDGGRCTPCGKFWPDELQPHDEANGG